MDVAVLGVGMAEGETHHRLHKLSEASTLLSAFVRTMRHAVRIRGHWVVLRRLVKLAVVTTKQDKHRSTAWNVDCMETVC